MRETVPQVFMDWARAVVVLQVLIQPCLSDLFTIEVEQDQYESEFGGEVVMGCMFQPGLSNLMVRWHWTSSNSTSREVVRMVNGTEQPEHQDPEYRGRVVLLKEELENGWAKLKISELRIGDSGTYQCVVEAGTGTDYREIQLSVTAPYRTVTKRLQWADDHGDEVLLSCRSEGFPESPVQWLDGDGLPVNASGAAATAAAVTPQQLVAVTSRLRVRPRGDASYACVFGGGSSASFRLPDELPPPVASGNGVPIASSVISVTAVVVLLLLLLLAVLLHRRRKDQRSKTGNDSEEKRICNDGLLEGSPWRGRSPDLGEEERLRLHAFATEVLPKTLRNNRGDPVGLQVLVPDPGKTVFLEGPPGSGKTTVARLLASSSGAVDLSGVRRVLHLDCGEVKGHLMQEVTRLLPEGETAASAVGSGEVLLLLDGYREGTQAFDESLTRFLWDRPACRVLIAACPGQSGALMDACNAGDALTLQLRPRTS